MSQAGAASRLGGVVAGIPYRVAGYIVKDSLSSTPYWPYCEVLSEQMVVARVTASAGTQSARPMKELPSSHLRLDRLVDLLVDSERELWSQPELADCMGMSPTELSAVLVRLQAEGLLLEVGSDRRVRLRADLDLTVASRVLPHLSAKRLGRRYHHYLRVGSTNDTARRLAEAGAPEGTTVVAEEQTRGRGRLGRAWLSRKSKDLLLSLVLRPAVDPAHAPGLSLMVGLAASQSIREVAGIPADLKWPNDVLTRGGKCCGVLTEMNADPGKIHFVIVGVGINVNGVSLPEAIAGQASTLARAAGCPIPRARLVASFLNHLEALYLEFLDKGLQSLIERWVAASSTVRGRRILVSNPGRSFSGTTNGLSEQGALRVRREDGTVEEVLAADIVQW